MPRLSEEQVAAVREVDLLTYLMEREPHELVRSGRSEYRTVSHGSLVLSNGKWYWNRGGFGGVSALNYLVKVRGMNFLEAVEMIRGVRAPTIKSFPVAKKKKREPERKTLILPSRVSVPKKLLSYLQRRGIGAEVTMRCISDEILYEAKFAGEPVCVFVGRDESGKARFACMRGITSDLRRDCAGSDYGKPRVMQRNARLPLQAEASGRIFFT